MTLSRGMSALVAASFLLAVSPVQAQQSPPPAAPPSEAEIAASPAVARFKDMLAVINGGDPARIKEFATNAAATPDASGVAFLLDIQRRTRGLDLVRVKSASATEAVAVVRDRLTGTEQAFAIAVKPEAPHLVTTLGEVPHSPDTPPAPTTEAAQLQGIGDYLKRLADADIFSGVVVVAKGGKPVLSRAYGFADRERKVRNTIEMPFLVGSMNKLFTGLAIGQLVEQGKLSYDDPLSKFIPDFPDAESAKRIKIKHLLSHTAGLSSFNVTYSPPGTSPVTVQTMLDNVEKTPLKFEPGTKWSYSNTGYQLLGKVIEVVTGRNYYDYVRENVYRRGGMTRNPFPDYILARVDMAKPYLVEWADTSPTWVDQMKRTTRRGGPAGGGIASASDLLKLGTAMNAGKIVAPATLRLHASAKPELAVQHYGYGFGLRARMAKRPLVGHGGDAPGQCAEWGALTDTPYTIIVLSNVREDYPGTCMAVIGKVINTLQPSKADAP